MINYYLIENKLMVENDMISFDELKTGFMQMYSKEFDIHSFLSTFLSNAIMIFQMYYFSDLPDIQEKYFGFFMGYIVYKLTKLFSAYIPSTYNIVLKAFYINRKYEDMTLLYKNGLIISIFAHIITYFPIKWLSMFIFTHTYLTRQNPQFVGGTIEKVGQYITIHFWAVLFECLTNGITTIISLFNCNNYVTGGNLLRFLLNVIFGVVYRKKYGDDYFVRGLSYADVFGELVVGVYLIIIQQMVNPNSQDYLSFNLDIIRGSYKSIMSYVSSFGFIFYFLLTFYDEIFMLLYVFLRVKEYEVTWYNFYFMCFIFKNMFFKIPRNDQMNFLVFYKRIRNDSSENLVPAQDNYDYDTKPKMNKNLELMFYIKHKVINILALNICIGLIYIVFYLFNGFHIVDINKTDLLAIIFFAINGIMEQLALFSKNIYCTMYNAENDLYQILMAVIIGLAVSIGALFVVHLLTNGLFWIVLVIYITYYLIFIKYYPIVKNTDLLVIKISLLLFEEKSEKEYQNYDNMETPNSSFDRIDQNLMKK